MLLFLSIQLRVAVNPPFSKGGVGGFLNHSIKSPLTPLFQRGELSIPRVTEWSLSGMDSAILSPVPRESAPAHPESAPVPEALIDLLVRELRFFCILSQQ